MIELTDKQRDTLQKAWGIYGNSGRKCTMLNHKLIQGFLHYNEDRREEYKEGNKNMLERHTAELYKGHRLTDECLEFVNLVLDNEIEKAIKLAKS